LLVKDGGGGGSSSSSSSSGSTEGDYCPQCHLVLTQDLLTFFSSPHNCQLAEEKKIYEQIYGEDAELPEGEETRREVVAGVLLLLLLLLP